MPPVLYIALHKLARCAQNDLCPQHSRIRPNQRHGILQLVAKARSTARLVKACLGPQPTANGLVQEPAVDHGIQQRVGRFDRRGTQQAVPGALNRLHTLHCGNAYRSTGQLHRSIRVFSVTD